MVDGFASDPEALARFKRVILRTRALIQKISVDVFHGAIGAPVRSSALLSVLLLAPLSAPLLDTLAASYILSPTLCSTL